jgi:predicted aminopeptidase
MTKIRLLSVVLLSLFIFTSCAKSLYILKLSWGETKILLGSIPVQKVLSDDIVDEKIKERIRLVHEVKEFSRKNIALRLNGSYEAFYQVKGDTLLYLVSACPKDSLKPYTWRFPIVGEVTYKGFFNRRDALEEIKKLEKRGLDISLQRAIAFSTLGWLNDPIYSTILDRNPVIIIYTIIHELVHNTIFFKGEMEFNEQLATFVGEKGTLMFIEEKFGNSSPYYQLALDLASDERLVSKFIQGLYEELSGIYGQEISWEEKMKRREEVFAQGKRNFADIKKELKTGYFDGLGEEDFNNALIIVYRHYLIPSVGILQRVYDTLDNDLKRFIELLKGLQKSGKSPLLYLERWLQERSSLSD